MPRWPNTRNAAQSTSTSSSASTAPALQQTAAQVALPSPVGGLPIGWGDQLELRPVHNGRGERSAGQVAGYVAKYATAMIRLVVAVGSDPVRHRRDAWPWSVGLPLRPPRERLWRGSDPWPHRPGAWLKTCRPTAT